MTSPIAVDPRVIAQALGIDTMDLARMLSNWAGDALPLIDFDKTWAPMELDVFDERVSRARRYLEDAHEAMKAWNEDNPETDDGE